MLKVSLILDEQFTLNSNTYHVLPITIETQRKEKAKVLWTRTFKGKNKCIQIRDKIQEKLDKKYGKNKKFALGIDIDDMRKANLITQEMEARIKEIKKEVVWCK